MSDNPMHQIDAEITGVIRTMSTSINQMVMHLDRGRGPIATGQPPGAGRGRGQAGRPGLRQTRPPSRRTLARMTNGQLTGYMVKTHMRGLAGQPVDAEARRLTGEFRRRGLDNAADGWTALGGVRARHLAEVAERQHAIDTADPALTTAALLDEHGVDPDQAVAEVRRDRYRSSAVRRFDDATALADGIAIGVADNRDNQKITGGKQELVTRPAPQTRDVDDARVGLGEVEAARRRGLDLPPRRVGSHEGWMSPAVETAVETVTVTAGLAGFEMLAEAIDAVGAEVGVDPVPAAGLDDAASEASDLAADGAPDEAVAAAEFASGAVTGQLGQALADQAGRATGTDQSFDVGQDSQADAHADQAAGVEQ
ncbi:hypothetical protein [Corynebacterium bovis]|uniref:hypothetical protein n=1 Tax=Corynebacterium bovis TaxID=36808 RepID=UPI000F63180F|nr:hypothetical protein [Corynebacterium bovis]